MFESKDVNDFVATVVANEKGELIREAGNGNEYIVIRLMIKGGKLGAQLKAVSKVVWSNSHSIIFDALADYIEDNAKDGDTKLVIESAVISGNVYTLTTPPYYFTDQSGEKRIANKVTFFLFEAENQAIDAEFTRLTAKFDWVTPDVSDEEAALVEGDSNPAEKKAGRRNK